MDRAGRAGVAGQNRLLADAIVPAVSGLLLHLPRRRAVPGQQHSHRLLGPGTRRCLRRWVSTGSPEHLDLVPHRLCRRAGRAGRRRSATNTECRARAIHPVVVMALEPPTGGSAFIAYPADPDLYHEHFLGCWIEKDTWMVVTPDHVMCAEKLAVKGNRAVKDVKFGVSIGVAPLGLKAGAQLYTFADSPDVETRRRWIREARVAAGLERSRRGLPPLTLADMPPVVPELCGPVVGMLPTDGGVGAGVGSGAAAPITTGTAIAALAAAAGTAQAAGSAIGAPAAAPAAALGPPGATAGDDGVDQLRAALEPAPLPPRLQGLGGGGGLLDPGHTPRTGGESSDARTLPMRYNAQGYPCRDFRDAVEICSEVKSQASWSEALEPHTGCSGSWQSKGPRSSATPASSPKRICSRPTQGSRSTSSCASCYTPPSASTSSTGATVRLSS